MSEEIKDEIQTNIDETAAATQKPENKDVDNKVPYDRFKAKVDEANALKDELAKLQTAREAEEQAKLVEQNEFKTLYEQAQEQLATIKADALNAKKDSLLAQAGYTSEQIGLLRNTVVGDTDEEIAQAIEGLKAVIAP